MTMQAIETWYAGCKFRSRLEARWAVLFDALGIRWEYEPEGFDLDGTRYLPDFHLPDIDVGSWFEVKGIAPNHRERQAAELLSSATGDRVFMAVGDLPRPTREDIDGWEGLDVFESGQKVDMLYKPCVCDLCGRAGIEFTGRHWRICQHGKEHRNTCGSQLRVQEAFRSARSARFEHGQVGASA